MNSATNTVISDVGNAGMELSAGNLCSGRKILRANECDARGR